MDWAAMAERNQRTVCMRCGVSVANLARAELCHDGSVHVFSIDARKKRWKETAMTMKTWKIKAGDEFIGMLDASLGDLFIKTRHLLLNTKHKIADVTASTEGFSVTFTPTRTSQDEMVQEALEAARIAWDYHKRAEDRLMRLCACVEEMAGLPIGTIQRHPT